MESHRFSIAFEIHSHPSSEWSKHGNLCHPSQGPGICRVLLINLKQSVISNSTKFINHISVTILLDMLILRSPLIRKKTMIHIDCSETEKKCISTQSKLNRRSQRFAIHNHNTQYEKLWLQWLCPTSVSLLLGAIEIWKHLYINDDIAQRWREQMTRDPE